MDTDVENSTKNANDTETIDSFYFYEVEQFTVLWILFIVIVAGNGAVLYTLLKKKAKNHRMNYFIRHLATADLLVGMINVLTDIIWRMTVSWNIGNAACKIIKFLQVVVTYASTYVLVALSIDRYDAIRYPMKFSSSWSKARCLIWSAWAISGVISTPILIFYNEKLVQDQLQCWIEFPHEWQWKVYMTMVSISLFIGPVTIISVCYTVIIVIIWSKSKTLTLNSRRNLGQKGPNRVSSSGVIPKAKVKTVKITLIIVTVFIMCWSPYIVFDLLQVYGHISTTQTNIAIATFIQSLAPLNSAANPIIYFMFSTHLCSTLGKLLPCGWAKCKRKRAREMSRNQSSTMSEMLTNSKQSTVI